MLKLAKLPNEIYSYPAWFVNREQNRDVTKQLKRRTNNDTGGHKVKACLKMIELSIRDETFIKVVHATHHQG